MSGAFFNEKPMKIKEDEPPYYVVDFCRRNDCQQIQLEDTSEEELKSFFGGIFSNKRLRGDASPLDGTVIKVRGIDKKKNKSKRILSMPLYNISPTQARVYTIKCIQYYFKQ